MIIKSETITKTAVCVAMVAVLSQISFPIPFSAVPFSMGIMAVFLCGAILKRKQAVMAQMIYLALGAIGVPVFSQFRGGINVLIGPTGGYLIAYILMAYIVALASEKAKKRPFWTLLLAMIASLLICYIIGTWWFSVVTRNSISAAIASCVLPFVLPDIAKAVLSAYFATILKKSIKTARL